MEFVVFLVAVSFVFAVFYVLIKIKGPETISSESEVSNLGVLGKIITYDGATGKGKILLKKGGNKHFDIDLWGSKNTIPEVGLPVVIKDNIVYADNSYKNIKGATSSVAHGMGTGVGILIVLVLVLIIFMFVAILMK